MKLVDILAQELAECPVKEGVYPPGQDYCVQSDECSQVFFCGTHGKILLSRRADKTSGVRVTRAEWQAAVDALNADKCEHSYSNNIGCPECGELSAPKVVEWDGEGEPPVGIECEWHPNVHGWVKVKILGRDGSDTWYRASGEEHSQTCRNMAFFRPIRTAEQVAAEEREKAIKEMMQHGVDAGDATIEYSCAALYDAGYRKEPKPCGS